MLKIAQSQENISSLAGISIVANHLDQLTALDAVQGLVLSRTKQGRIDHRCILRSAIALQTCACNDFVDIESCGGDPAFAAVCGGMIPSQETFRQRLDQLGELGRPVRDLVDAAVVQQLQGVSLGTLKVAGQHLIPLDVDVSVFEEPWTRHKEGVGCTYHLVSGYAPIFAYVGTQGFLLADELRVGPQHCSKGALEFVARCVAMLERLGVQPEHLLLRVDSGHDDLEFVNGVQQLGVHFLIKRNFRREAQQQLIDQTQSVHETRTHHHGWTTFTAMLADQATLRFAAPEHVFLAAEVIEKHVDAEGQPLLIPEVELNCWWTNLLCEARWCVRLYHDHGTSEQYHSELKSELQLERLPSGKMSSNALWLSLAAISFNCLRKMGQHALHYARRTGAAVLTEPAEGRRLHLRTVIDHLIRVGGKFVAHAGQCILKLGRSFTWFKIFDYVYKCCCD